MADPKRCSEAYGVLCETYRVVPQEDERDVFARTLARVPNELVADAVMLASERSPAKQPSAGDVLQCARELARQDRCRTDRCANASTGRNHLTHWNRYEQLARLWERYPPGAEIPDEHEDRAQRIYAAAGVQRWRRRPPDESDEVAQ